ncbi:MAG: ABC transporter permease, partial [Bradyrhizobium sp.]|nr:ABC transporter permease [Bradyrhizobium sp.]
MSRIGLFSLQMLVAIAVVALWQFFASVPVAGKIWLPPFFFSNPVD